MKKNIIKKCMAMMLSLISLFSIACTKDESSSPSLPVGNQSTKENKYKLIENGLSDYVIILPENGEGGETLASGILTSNLYNATGCKLEYKTDAQYNATEDSKFISIGETKAYLDTNLSIDKNSLNGDGFVIKTVGDDIYIVGGKNSNSYIYSAYDLLKIFIDYEAYTDDEIYYRSTKNVGFDDIDMTEIPDIASRHLYNSWATAPNNLTLTDQILRTHKDNWSSYGDGHTIFYFLPPDTYAKEHPEWYSGTTPGRGQICWSNEGLLEEMCKQVIEHIKKESELVTNVMVAQNDGGVWCSCQACIDSKIKYGTDSAAVVKAINKIAEAVENYLRESGQAEREIYVTTFAYLQTKEPPVKEENGKFVPIDESVKMRKNTAVRIAPIEMNYSVPANDEELNNVFRDIFMGWSAVCDKLMLWDYSVNPSQYLVPQVVDFSVLQDNYKFFKECGVYSAMLQGAWNCHTNGFNPLKNYLMKNIMWDVDCDVDALADDFFDNYYKDASSSMRKFLEEYRLWYRILQADKDVLGDLFINYDTLGKELFPLAFIERLESYIEEAKQSIEYLQEFDYALYQKLYKRIDVETLFTHYVRVFYYTEDYSESELRKLRIEFKEKVELHNITGLNEAQPGKGSLQNLIKSWGI